MQENQEKMTPKIVGKYIKQAGFKSKAEFAREMGLKVNTVNLWAVQNPIPPYFFKVLEWAKKAKAYDLLNLGEPKIYQPKESKGKEKAKAKAQEKD